MAVHHDTDQKLAEHDKAQAHGDKASHESEKQAEKDKQAAAKEAEVDNSPDAIVTRIEGLVAQMHDATPSGTLTIQEQMIKELTALRGTAPPPPEARANKTGYSAAKDDDDDDDEEKKAGKAKRK
jgi:hypothetical protein